MNYYPTVSSGRRFPLGHAPAAIRTRTAPLTMQHPAGLDHGSMSRAASLFAAGLHASSASCPLADPRSGASPSCTGTSGSGDQPAAVADTAPEDRERESNARLEGHSLASCR